ncbi:MAG: DUF1638 domain-containing protein [Candidatus Adiutrix sp.]|jgi:hypothetical protein|nr:DUF1638 domain-containing protein [Candidatus Adiutrix sp.]
MEDKTTVIACGIFQEEVEQVLAEDDLKLSFDWREAGLHDNIERLEEDLGAAVAARLAAGGRRPALLYGCGCLPEMKAFARERGLAVLPVKNCLAALVGDEQLRELEKDRTMVASIGWVRKMWLGRRDSVLGWKADDYRMQFGRYDRIVVLDTGHRPLSDEEIITCFDLVQVPIEAMSCGLGHFQRVFLDLIRAAASAPLLWEINGQISG